MDTHELDFGVSNQLNFRHYCYLLASSFPVGPRNDFLTLPLRHKSVSAIYSYK